MAETSWPSAGPATVDEWDFEQTTSAAFGSGVVGVPTDPSPCYADATGLHVKLRAGATARVRGFMWAAGGTDVQLSISANSSGSTRVDLVVLRLDRSTWQVRGAVVEGTPGGGVPAVQADVGTTGMWDLVIAVVTVPDGTTTTVTGSMVTSTPFHLGPQLILTSANSAWPAANNPEFWLRYITGEDRLVLSRPAGQVDLWRDTGRIVLATSNGGWAADSGPSWVWRRGSTVTFNLGNYQRTSSSLSAGADSRLPGSIVAGCRLPGSSGDHAVGVAVAVGNSFGRVVVYPENHPTRANQIWLLQHSGVGQGVTVRGCTATWQVSL